MAIPHASVAEREVLIEREFDAPSALVFRAWIDPEQLVRWYAPRGCTIQFWRIDPREGGTFHSCIRSSDGHECWCIGTFLEVAPSERLVYTLAMSNKEGQAIDPNEVGMDPEWPRETTLTVTFAEENGKTKLTLRQAVSESLAKKTGAHPSWLQMLDRLDELVVQK